jgi:NAD(P)-dependent dehydrogenase (short-subunit alcohol dehydrogenase family)
VAIVGLLATDEGVTSVAEQSLAAAPVLHVLVHNAAVNPRPHESFDDVEPDIFREAVRVNVAAPLFLTQALLGPLRAARSARVVFLSSQAGQFVNCGADDDPADPLRLRDRQRRVTVLQRAGAGG